MSAKFIRAFVATGALAGLCASWGCVSDRPSRNGVYNENQYVRKSFLIRPGDGTKADTGWLMQATITKTSTPNPLGGIGLYPGHQSGGYLVRFQVTSDKLQMLNMREISAQPDVDTQGTRQPEVVNAWPATNVDLKYQVNLDGEKTNYYQENQELDWQQRQWVKLNFSKNDLSDVAPLGAYQNYMLGKCVDLGNASTTLSPGSFVVDEQNDYIQWAVDMTLPVRLDDEACAEAYGTRGDDFVRMGRQSVNITLMYSMVRATSPDKITYTPFVLQEKDPMRRKYGAFEQLGISRDFDSGLLAGRAMVNRWDPNKPAIQWYFAPGYPKDLEDIWNGDNGIVKQTNDLLAQSGAKTKLNPVKHPEDGLKEGETPPQFGDIRYSFVRYESDIDTGSPFIGETQWASDPRTGEIISAIINMPQFAIKDAILARLDFYLTTIGANLSLDPATGEWPDPGPCTDGDVQPLVPEEVAKTHNGNSTLYDKMQQYMFKPVSKYGKLGPVDFVYPHTVRDTSGNISEDKDFYNALYTVLPYMVYADPAANQYVIWEGGTGTYAPTEEYKQLQMEAEFHKEAGMIDRGWAPIDVTTGSGSANVDKMHQFLTDWQAKTINHRNLQRTRQIAQGRSADAPGMINYLQLFQKDARHCVGGAWETRADYVKRLIKGYTAFTMWHEFGHAMGLRHNFMGSVDRPNFPVATDAGGNPMMNKDGNPQYGMYSSSVMEYNVAQDTLFWSGATGGGYGWGPYDQAAIAFIYSNAQTPDSMGPDGNTVPAGPRGSSVSGQTDGTHPWNDPLGFRQDGSERTFLYGTDEHSTYTPFCRTHDFGTTPSEIIANDIDTYEWNYQWRNFRLYHKFWNESQYADLPTQLVDDMKRFLAVWAYDWSSAELQDTLRRLGVNPPNGIPAKTYYANLTNQFDNDISRANMMVAAFHKAIIQQSSGERPYASIYDNFFGDLTQQGITIDKLQALQSWTALWKVDNFDPDQAQGAYIASFVLDAESGYQSVAEDAVTSMIGGVFDSFPYFKPLAVSQFSEATHDVNFVSTNRPEVRDWVGGKVFTRERDFLDYMRGLASRYNKFGCTSIDSCTYDPRTYKKFDDDYYQSDLYNRFVGPDGRRYIWAYVADRNTWVLADQDRNVGSYLIFFNLTSDTINGEDDSTTAYTYQLPAKYFLDYFNAYN